MHGRDFRGRCERGEVAVVERFKKEWDTKVTAVERLPLLDVRLREFPNEDQRGRL